jgi:hypothetical protein
MGGSDLLKLPLEPLRAALYTALAARGIPPGLLSAALDLFDAVGVLVVGALMLPIVSHLYGRARAGSAAPRRWWLDRSLVVAAVAAAALLTWIVSHPAAQLTGLFTRWDHVAFSALAGGVFASTSLRVRVGTLSLLSVTFMLQHFGPVATAVVLTANLIAFAAIGRRGAGAVVLAAIWLAIYALCLLLRAQFFVTAVSTSGLFAFVFLRQISAAVTLAGAPRPAFGSYLCYLIYYPGAYGLIGGPEVYADFARRNLAGQLHHDPRRALRDLAVGALQIWLAARIPITATAVLESPSMVAAWGNSLLMFVRTALYGMGIWAMVDATALYHGFRLHPNFRGILTRQNPSELWWAWRSMFTNWLVRHVYAPLGGSERHQSLNIAAAFGVSWLWHVLGLPFGSNHFRIAQAAPITLWALINALAVIGHVQVRKRGLRILPAATPTPLRRGVHMFLTACLGTFSVTFFQFQGNFIDRFVPFLQVLFGLPR